jgi:hypothetical protein
MRIVDNRKNVDAGIPTIDDMKPGDCFYFRNSFVLPSQKDGHLYLKTYNGYVALKTGRSIPGNNVTDKTLTVVPVRNVTLVIDP